MEEDNLEENINQEEFEGNLEDLMQNEDFKGLMMDYLLFFTEYVKTTNEGVYKRAAEYAADLTGFVLLDFQIKEDSDQEEENKNE
jgi:hypothetical protein